MSFAKRIIAVEFDLANGQFEGGGNKLYIDGLRVSCNVINLGGPTAGQMQLTIWGLTLSQMNQLVTTGTQLIKMNQNHIKVYAGDEDIGTSLIWAGDIVTAIVDGRMPAVCLHVLSLPGAYYTVVPATPLSIQGSADAAGMVQQLAQQVGLGFENAGVEVQLSNPYYAGSVWQQIYAIARHAGFNVVVDRGTLCVVPSNGSRQGDAPLISPETGMIGYPSFDQAAINVTALFNPSVLYNGTVQIQSGIQAACGSWTVYRLEYYLEAQLPSGHWDMTIMGVINN